MEGPQCRADVALVDHIWSEIDGCDNCGRIWLRYPQLERARELLEGASLGLASISVGGSDEMVYVEGTRRFSRLDQEESEQPELVTSEVCGTCAGSFFDGGELCKMLSAG